MSEVTYTRAEIEDVARHFGPVGHWRAWLTCGAHDVAQLPVTADTGEPFCPRCCVFFSDSDSAIDPPKAPAVLPWACSSCGEHYTDDEVMGPASARYHLAAAKTAAGSPMPITCGPLRPASV